jgi:protein-L-isoaspartate(D-aspartate) O-methyltransferase
MDFAALRHRMVQSQLRGRGITDERVLAVMEEAPRHLFVPEGQRKRAYGDEPLPIGLGQTISQPYMVARMTELLRLSGTETVLEIGTGSGYQAAVLGRLAARVWTVERHPELAKRAEQVLLDLGYANIEVVVGDGTVGLPAAAPFDAVVVTAAAPCVPEALREQLSVGGLMVIPVSAGSNQDLLLLEKFEGSGGTAGAGGRAGEDSACAENAVGADAAGHSAAPPSHFRETSILGCVFVPLIGEQGYPQ